MLMEVNTTKVKQEANGVLGTAEKTLYYLLIGTGENKTVLNVGEKTYVGVSKQIAEASKRPENK